MSHWQIATRGSGERWEHKTLRDKGIRRGDNRKGSCALYEGQTETETT